MRTYKIYTAGKMSGLTQDEQIGWRFDIAKAILNAIQNKFDPPKIEFIHPPLFYQYGAEYHKSEREVKEWDTTQVMNSDIVIVNTDYVADSTGTHFELAMCDAVNRLSNKHIFVIGIGKTKPEELHPWIAESIMRYEENVYDAAEYIADYLLI